MTAPPRDHWDEFRSWHSGPQLWREIYARTVSALSAALVIYVIAAAAGVVTRAPLFVIVILLEGLGIGLLIFSVPGVAANWSRVKPLFVTWNDDESPEMQHAKRLYVRFIWGLFLAVMAGFLIGVFVAHA